MFIFTSEPTIAELLAALARVDRELLEIDQRAGLLVELGRQDLLGEKRLILRELAAIRTAAGKEEICDIWSASSKNKT